jgi:hypothetical protein
MLFATTVSGALSRLGSEQRGMDPYPRRLVPMLLENELSDVM